MTFGWQKNGFELSLASSEADVQAAQRLRYDVFVEELGGNGPQIDHAERVERDRFDAFSDHLMLRDLSSGQIAAVYRMLRSERAKDAGGFYTESEFDLSLLRGSGRNLLELGRSCVRAEYRGSAALFHIWSGLAQYVDLHGSELLFGSASFQGTDISNLAAPLSLLHHAHLAPAEIRPRAIPYQRMDLIAPDRIERRAATLSLPPLVKAYLRLGGTVGEGAFVDRDFNCTDVCMVMDTSALNEKYARHYTAEAAQ